MHLHGSPIRVLAKRQNTKEDRIALSLSVIGDEVTEPFEFERIEGKNSSGRYRLVQRKDNSSRFNRIFLRSATSAAVRATRAPSFTIYESIWEDYQPQPLSVMSDAEMLPFFELGEAITKPPDKGETETPDNESFPAALTYIGQFIAHDLSAFTIEEDDRGYNFQTTALDLSSIFENPPLLNRRYIGQTRTSGGTRPADIDRDLPRHKGGLADIPDLRNDHNLALAQVHNMVARFFLKERERLGCDEQARRSAINHFQRAVLDDYLSKLTCPDLVEDLLDPQTPRVIPKKVDPSDFLVPLEFALAFFRFGHAQVRNQYEWRAGTSASLKLLLELTHEGGAIRIDDLGRKWDRLSDLWILDWTKMIGEGAENKARCISARLSHGQGKIPFQFSDQPQAPYDSTNKSYVNLAAETLIRGERLGLPDAQFLTKWIKYNRPGVPDLGTNLSDPVVAANATRFASDDLKQRVAGDLSSHTPLWLYTLLESQATTGGVSLGPLAGRIVAETLIAAIEADIHGVLGANSGFSPPAETFPSQGEKYTFEELVRYAFAQ